MISWGNDIKEYALQQAQSGVHFDGWKIVEGRSNRKFTDEAAVAFKVKDAGYDPYEKEASWHHCHEHIARKEEI